MSGLTPSSPTTSPPSDRRAVFVSHANPESNVFTLWLCAKLAALGYDVWADVLRLRGGQDWQRLLEHALRHQALKVLLVGTPLAVDKQGVRNELQIANDVAKQLGDPHFIVPLRLERFDAPFLIAQAQHIDFSRGWSIGLVELLDTLETTYRVPRFTQAHDTRWQELQTLHATTLVVKPERLTSNWAAISALPKTIRYFEFSASASREEINFKLGAPTTPVVRHGDGCLSFAPLGDLTQYFGSGVLSEKADAALEAFIHRGWSSLGIERRTAQAHFSELTLQGVERFLHQRGLNGYQLANERLGWWAPVGVAPPGKVSFQWGDIRGARKIVGASLKRGFHWHFGVTVNARLWPLHHLRLTSRLIFTEDGFKPIKDPRRMHRLRRSFAKSWRNPRWRDMLLAFLYWVGQGKQELAIPLGTGQWMIARLPPLTFAAPIGISHDTEPTETDDEEDPDDGGNEWSPEEDDEDEQEEGA